jgi:hypothetical protein
VNPRDPDDVAAYDALLAEVTIGPVKPLSGRITVRDYDPTWPDWKYMQQYADAKTEVIGEIMVRAGLPG